MAERAAVTSVPTAAAAASIHQPATSTAVASVAPNSASLCRPCSWWYECSIDRLAAANLRASTSNSWMEARREHKRADTVSDTAEGRVRLREEEEEEEVEKRGSEELDEEDEWRVARWPLPFPLLPRLLADLLLAALPPLRVASTDGPNRKRR